MVKMIMLPDLHWGAISPERMKEELDKTLFSFLKCNRVNVIMIAGDLFDSKQYFTSDVVRYVINFLCQLLHYTDNIVCIQGTKTHDDLQLETLKTIFTNIKFVDTGDFWMGRVHFITKPTIMQIRNDDGYIEYIKPDEYTYEEFRQTDEDENMTLLCLPEEYVIDQESYYKPYFENKYYDMILFHGMVDKIWYAKINKSSQTELTKYSSAPVFKVDDLLEHCNRCYAGHIHVHKHYGQDGRFLYVGPFTRWEFGKEEDVGCEYVEFEHQRFKDKFLVNHNAQVLTTKVLNITESIPLKDLNDKLDSIIESEMSKSDKLRFIINIKSNIQNYLEIKDFIISKLGDMKFIKLVLSIDTDDDYMDAAEETMDSSSKSSTQKNYLFESMDLEERIRLFLKQKKGLDISIEDIKSVLRLED